MLRARIIPVGLLLLIVGLVAGIYFWTEFRQANPAITSAHQGELVTEKEAEAYGRDVEAAIAAGNIKRVNDLFRADELAERVADSVNLSSKARELIQTLRKKMPDDYGENVVVMAVQNGGKVSFVRVREDEGNPHVLFRMVFPNGGFSYVEVTLARHPDGKIAADDIYPMVSGEPLSQTTRRFFIKIAASADAKALPKLSAADRLFYDNGEKVKQVIIAIKEGRKREAYAIYSQLPAELKKEKWILLMGMAAAQEAGDDEYLQVVESFRKNFPNDPALDLLSHDYFFLKKNFKEAYACLDRLDKTIGGDPYLAVPRGKIMIEEGRYRDAKAEFEKAIEQCPGQPDAYWGRIMVAALEKNHAETLEWFKKAVVLFDTACEKETLRHNGSFAPFLDSAEYQELLKWQSDRKK